MQRNLVRSILFAFTALLLIGGSLLAIRAVLADPNQRVALSGQIVPLVQKAQFLQATDPNQQLDLSIGLQLRNSAELDSLLSTIYDPNSPQYHDYLTPDQFDSLFAPTADQVQQVVTFLQSQSLTITSVAPNNLLIDATGTVAQVQQAFNLQINNYMFGNRVFYSNAGPPNVPVSISQLITERSGVIGSINSHPERIWSQRLL
jgi:subtilase family serine protease